MSSVTPSSERIGGSLIGNELAMQFASETIAKNSSKFVDRKARLDPIRFEIFELKNELFVNIFAVLRFAELETPRTGNVVIGGGNAVQLILRIFFMFAEADGQFCSFFYLKLYPLFL